MTTKRTISGLTPGTWAFRFKAINENGLSGDWSPAFLYTVIGDTTPPPTPSKPNVTSVVGGVSVKWIETVYQTPIDFNRVDVYVSSGGAYTKFGSIASINSVVTYVPLEGVTGPFTFKFTGVDRSGNVSALSEASDSVFAGTIGIDTTPPSVPSGLSVLAYNDSSDTSGATGYVDVSWTGSTSTDLLGHYIRYGRTSSVWDEYLFIQAGQNTKRIFNLKSGTTYYFQVNATDGSNPSSYVPSTPISVVIPGDVLAPLAPSDFVAISGLDNIIAYWSRNSEPDVDFARGQYEVQVSTSSLFSTITEDCVISGTVATFNGLTTGTLYYVRVRAIDSSGNTSPWSTTASTTPSTLNASTSLTAGTIVGNLIAANTIVGDKIQTNTIDADRFKTNTGIAGIIYVGSDDSPTGTNRIVLDGSSILPKIYYGSGVYNNSNTAFYLDAAGKFSLKDQLTWDGSALTVKGSLNVTQASTMTANLNINSGGSLIVNGGAIRVTGTAGRVEMSSLGIVGYNASTGGSPLVTIQANTGQIVATGGQIGGFTLGPTSLTTTNSLGQVVGLYSTGQFSLGSNFNISAAGDVTATGTFTIAGTGQTAIAANQVNSNVTSISGGAITTGTINLNNVLINSGSGTTSTMKLSSSGLEIWNSSGTRTVFLTPSGNASFNGEITSTTGNIAGFSMDADGLINSGGTLRLFAGTTGINNVYSIFTSKPVRFGQFVQIEGSGFGGYSLIGAEGMSLANGGFAINSSGTVTSNATFNSYIYYPGYPVSTSGGAARVNDATTPSSRLVAASGSSIRFKENIVNISEKPDLDPSTLLNLPVRSFTYKQGYLPEDDARYGMDLPGFIAEELEEVYPIAVDRDADGTPQRWNSDFIIPGLLKIIQTQNDSILSIKSRLDALES